MKGRRTVSRLRSLASSRTASIAALIAMPLMLFLVGMLLREEFSNTGELRRAANQSYRTRFEIQHLLSLHQDVETGTRGFLLTNERQYLAPYESARTEISRSFETLGGALAGVPEAQRELRAIQELSRQKLAISARSISERDEGSPITPNAGEQSRQLMDEIRAHVMTLDGIESARLVERDQLALAQRQASQTLALTLLTVLAVLLCVAGLVIFRTLESRRTTLDRLKDLSARRHAVLESVTDAIITLNPSGSLESMNGAAERMFGYSQDELLRREVGIFLAKRPSDGQIQNYLKQVGDPDGEQAGRLREAEARRSDGSTFPIDMAVSPMPLADGMHYVAVIRDISERKRVERMKAEFVSTVSHELRTPLTSIAGSLGLLAGGAGGALPERAARLISIAHGNSDRLVRLINDILDIEKMESGQVKFNNMPLNLGELAAQAVEANRGYAERFGVDMEIVPAQVSAQVNSDPDRLMQVMTNLLSNAIKFSPRGEAVRITITPGEFTHRLTVSDRGLGIPEAFRERIFEKFAQADASDSRQKGGTGLGLAIVREIVSRVGGRISFDSRAYQGTDFHVDLPAFRSATDIDARPLLLLGCSESQWAEEMCRALEGASYACVVAADAKAVQVLALERRPVAILLDITLPDEGGIALIRALRSDSRLPMMPILAMSGHGDVRGETLAVVDWLGKPVAPPRLIEAVRQALKANADLQPQVLHVDDDPDILQIVSSAFEGRASITSVASLESARAALAGNSFDLVILDLGLADGSGFELLPQLHHRDGSLVPVVIFSAQDADPELTGKVEAVLTKSRTSLAKLVRTVEEIMARRGPGK